MKVKSFVTSIIMLIISAVLVAMLWSMNLQFKDAVNSSSTGGLIMVVFLPIGIIVALLTLSSCVSGLTSSIMACFSDSKSIKILSIILLILTLAVIGFAVYSVCSFVNLV